jgi:hypothetical protein
MWVPIISCSSFWSRANEVRNSWRTTALALQLPQIGEVLNA